jgi:hypothetical protein
VADAKAETSRSSGETGLSSLTDQERAQLAYLERFVTAEDAALFRALVARFGPSHSSGGPPIHCERGLARDRG